MDKDKIEYFDSNDNRLLPRQISIQSLNQSTALIKENKRDIYSKIYYAFSLIFAVFIAIFSNYFGIITFLIFLNLFLIFLIYNAKKFHMGRRELAKDHEKIRKNLNEWGIDMKSI